MAELRRTVAQKSKRHKYFCPEIRKYLELIKDTNEIANKTLRIRYSSNKFNRKKFNRYA